MENIAENKKNKIGRPKKHESLEMALLKNTDVRLQSIRHLNDTIYNTIMIALLADSKKPEEFKHLADFKTGKAHRKTIMTALGRIREKYENGEELALELAREICKQKMNTEKAIQFINRTRNFNGETLGQNKLSGVLKRIIRIIKNANLNEKEITKLFDVLVMIDKNEFKNNWNKDWN